MPANEGSNNYTSKAVVGAVTTYTITDSRGTSATLAVTNNPITGNTTTLTGTGVRSDAMKTMAQLLLQTSTGLVP
jgi:hypothetical protein